MRADFAFLADYAAEKGGNVGAMGVGIDTLVTPQFPTTHPHVFLVIQVRSGPDELNLHNIGLRIVDSQGNPILNQRGAVDFSAVPPGNQGVARLVFGFYLITFPKADQYYFVVQEGETVLARLPMLLLQSAPMPQPVTSAPAPEERTPALPRRGRSGSRRKKSED